VQGEPYDSAHDYVFRVIVDTYEGNQGRNREYKCQCRAYPGALGHEFGCEASIVVVNKPDAVLQNLLTQSSSIVNITEFHLNISQRKIISCNILQSNYYRVKCTARDFSCFNRNYAKIIAMMDQVLGSHHLIIAIYIEEII
jgi:hypothetical protein